MKKLLTYFSIAAIIAGFATSCGKDDDGNDNSKDNVSSIQKRLVKAERCEYYSETLNCGDITFEYDNQGRCVSISDVYQDFRISYEDNKIILEMVEFNDRNITVTYTLNSNGFIESTRWVVITGNYVNQDTEEKFQYDEKGQLIEYTDSDGSKTTFIWENGNVIKSIDKYGDWVEYKYTDETNSTPIENKAKFHIAPFEDLYRQWPHFCNFGVPNRHLPVGIVEPYEEDYEEDYDPLDHENVPDIEDSDAIEKDSISHEEWKWTLDNDGYPLKLDIDEDYNSEYHWE